VIEKDLRGQDAVGRRGGHRRRLFRAFGHETLALEIAALPVLEPR